MHPLDHMLNARSVAIVGASDRPGSVGDQTVRQLIDGGFDGQIFLINPSRKQLGDFEVRASIDDVEAPLDLAVLAVANERLEAELEKAVKSGVRSVAIFGSCHGEAHGGGSLRDRLSDIAIEAGVPICGGNGMGFVNVEKGLRVCGFFQPADLLPGGITFLSHSGSLFSAMLHNRRGLRFNLVVSTGLELNTTMDRYLEWALGLESTRVIALFLETVRDPAGLTGTLRRAQAGGIPVVAMKVGASARGGEAVATHSGAIAGADAAYEALFDTFGVHRVWTMDEMADTLELFSAGREATVPGLGAVHDSGGERALLIDVAERTGVTLPVVSAATSARLAGLLDPGLEPSNPVDAWGTGREAEDVFVGCMAALADDPAIGAVAFCVDLTAEEHPEHGYAKAALEASQATSKPLIVVGNLSTTIDPVQAGLLRQEGVPVLEGTETALRAVRHLFDRHVRSTLPRPAPRLTEPRRLTGVPADEAEEFQLLGEYGIPTPKFMAADDEASAIAAGTAIGWPVVLKTRGRAHKAQVGGVRTGLGSEEAMALAYRELAARLGPAVLIFEQVPAGVELAMGMVNDPQFGPVVLVSAGGTMIELMSDRAAVLAPVDGWRAGLALDRLAVRPLLDGAVGSQPADVGAFVDALARFSELAVDAVDVVSSMDLNPVIVGPNGAIAVDVLVVGK